MIPATTGREVGADWLAFVGPSLDPVRVTAEFDGDVRPPIARGNLCDAVNEGYRKIAIIDGVFDQSLSVSVEEIRDAIAAGVTVAGAASMGALRAADAGPIGMYGTGWIYDRYRDGRLTSEADVALLFDPNSGLPLTVPLVNVRWVLELALHRGLVTENENAALLEHASAIDYRERTWHLIVSTASDGIVNAARQVAEMVTEDPCATDRKALDALELLRKIMAGVIPLNFGSVPAPTPPDWLPTSPERQDFVGELATESEPADIVLSRARYDADLAQVTRLTDLSRLDDLGVHVWSACRPLADRGDLTVNGGKGFTSEDARIGALFECVERWSMTPRNRKLRRASYSDLRKEDAIDPRSLILDVDCGWTADDPIDWIEARELLSGAAMWVPAIAVLMPFPSDSWMFRYNTSGVAAGRNLAEATFTAMLELIERDAVTFFACCGDGTPIDLECALGPRGRALLLRLRAEGLSVHAYILPSPISVPVVQVVVDDQSRDSPMYINGGSAAHPDARVACEKALLEAVFSRLTVIAGARERLDRDAAESSPVFETRAGLARLDAFPAITLDALPIGRAVTPQDLSNLVDEIAKVGFPKVLACQLGSTGLKSAIVRVIIPGMECATTERRIGPRLFRRIRELVRGGPVQREGSGGAASTRTGVHGTNLSERRV